MTTEDLDRIRAALADDGEAREIPDRIGRFEVRRVIGSGGSAVVLEAWDPELAREVAIKLIDEGHLARLGREARAAGSLRHPNIVTVLDVGDDYIAMELVRGKSLAALLPTLGRDDRLAILETVARAVAHAHERGVIHRDLKPGNILVEDGGRVVLTDFGLARFVTPPDGSPPGPTLTRAGSVMGTPGYMAPEQVRGDSQATGPATDVWALGVMLFQMLTERMPFGGEVAAETFADILRRDPPTPPGPLGPVTMRALARDPQARYASAGDFADELARVRRGEAPTTRGPGLAARLLRGRRHATAAVALALLVLAALATAGWSLALRSRRAAVVLALREQVQSTLDALHALRRLAPTGGDSDRLLPAVEDAYRRAEALAPDEPAIHHLMGRVARARGDRATAAAFEERALVLDRSYLPALYESAVLASYEIWTRTRRSGRTESGVASAAWTRFREAAARDPVAATNLGPAALAIADALAEGDPPRTDALERASRLDPLRDEVWDAIAHARWLEALPARALEARIWTAAKERLSAALARGEPGAALSLAQLRWIRASQLRHQGGPAADELTIALTDVARAVDEARQDPLPVAWRGQLHLYQALLAMDEGGAPDPALAAAERDLEHAIALAPRRPLPWLWRGHVRFHRARYIAEVRGGAPGGFEAAEADMDRAVALDPAFCQARKLRGRLRVQRGVAVFRAGGDPEPHFRRAEEDFDRCARALTLDPWAFTWRATLELERGCALARAGQDGDATWTRAETTLTQALSLDAGHDEAWRHRGWVRLERAAANRRNAAQAARLYRSAIADLVQAMALNPGFRPALAPLVGQAQRALAELPDEPAQGPAAERTRAPRPAPGPPPPGSSHVIVEDGDGDHPGPGAVVLLHVDVWDEEGQQLTGAVAPGWSFAVPLRALPDDWASAIAAMREGERRRIWPAAGALEPPWGAGAAVDLALVRIDSD